MGKCRARRDSVPAAGKEPGSKSLVAAHRHSYGEVLAFIEEKRQVLRAEQKRAGRDVLLGYDSLWPVAKDRSRYLEQRGS
jgi:hypothetical protein